MRAHHSHTIRLIFSNLSIESSHSVRFCDRQFEAESGTPYDGRDDELMINLIKTLIYDYAYARVFDIDRIKHGIIEINDFYELTSELSLANQGQDQWFCDWVVEELLSDGRIKVKNRLAERILAPGEYVHLDGPGTFPRKGGTVNIFQSCESVNMQAGYYFAFGDEPQGEVDFNGIVRFYWNIDADKAVQLMKTLTKLANQYRLPFRFKCLKNRDAFERLDSAVLYVPQFAAHFTGELLVDVYRDNYAGIKHDTPLFTRRLAPGLGFAEEPGTGESFGMSRCQILADGIYAAYLKKDQSVEGRERAVKEIFSDLDLDFEKPYLRPGAVDRYEFPIFTN